ncbi:hypothetical protein [Nostoc sp. NMS4]|uniref:hypothetical protein n=1 Tax=Nostoc sp. NMS4 TaxID=2815390 RepID=UPI0025CFA954|nr:hypothetical protein [Nostoc sp. NMS4]MBN3922405.1 hypothetical protein [Nostoc sp. NMS4]
METVTATFLIPDWINEGLKTKAYERVGGVIRDFRTKQIVAMLRETVPYLTQASTILSQFGSAASILNLGVSVIGFVVVIKRLGDIEQRLKIVQQDVKKLNLKFDLSVYANFRAALDLARDGFTMTKHENRVNMANLAINRFLEAQHTYTGYFDTALEEDIEVADEYLSSIFLTYVARVSCYLELKEISTACLCLQEGTEFLNKCVNKYFDKVFSYLDDEEQEKFYKNYPLLLSASYITVNGVITGIFGYLGYFGYCRKPLLIASPVLHGNLLEEVLLWVTSKKEEETVLDKALEKLEAIIETNRRFQSYQTELQAIAQLGISFDDWLKLTPSTEIKPDGAELMYIIPSKLLELQPSI